jgi:hypothetical protein
MYLTCTAPTYAQVPTGSDGHPDLMGEPLVRLRSDFPLTPGLMGHLVPQAINLWMGAAR